MQFIGKGHSLWPFIPPGSLIRLVTKKLSLGDLVAYHVKNEIICHRLIEIKERDGLNWFLLKGDANLEADGWIPEYRMLGVLDTVDGKPLNPHFQKLIFILSLFIWKSYSLLRRVLIRHLHFYRYHHLADQTL